MGPLVRTLVGVVLFVGCSSEAADRAADSDAGDCPPDVQALADDAAREAAFVATDAAVDVADELVVVDAPSDVFTDVTPDVALDVAADTVPPADAGPVLKPRVVALGNSLTFGSFSSNPATMSYPARMRDMLGPRWEASQWLGKSGWGTAQIYFARPFDLAPFRDEARSRKVLVYWEYTNDQINDYTCTAVEKIARESVAEGWTVVVATAIPDARSFRFLQDGGIATNTLWWADRRDAYNKCLRNGYAAWGATSLVDLDAAPAFATPYDRTYYAADAQHLVDAGYLEVATLVTPVVDSLYVAP